MRNKRKASNISKVTRITAMTRSHDVTKNSGFANTAKSQGQKTKNRKKPNYQD